jgi:hypothetical protein
MPLYDQKREDDPMTSHFVQKAQQTENRWLLLLLPSILGAESLIATVDPASLAAATECQVDEGGGTIQAMTTWKGATSRALPLTITVNRDIYGGLIPPPVLEIAPYKKSSRIDLGNTENQETSTIGVCVSQNILESALFNHAMITSIGTTQTTSHKKAMKVFALPYKGDRHVLMIRTTPPDIGISVRNTPRTILGPVQEIQKSMPPDPRNVSQTVARLPSTVESPSLFGGRPLVAVHAFQNALQLPGHESLRMNQTTAQAVHDGNRADGCP